MVQPDRDFLIPRDDIYAKDCLTLDHPKWLSDWYATSWRSIGDSGLTEFDWLESVGVWDQLEQNLDIPMYD